MHRSLKVMGSLGLIGVGALICYLASMPWLILVPIAVWCSVMAWDYLTTPEPRTPHSYTPQEIEIMRIRDELEACGDFIPPTVLNRLVQDYRHITGS